MLGWFNVTGAVWVSAEGTQTYLILLVLPGSISDLRKEILSTLDGRNGADLILVGKWDDVIFAYVVWFQYRFWVFIPPFF